MNTTIDDAVMEQDDETQNAFREQFRLDSGIMLYVGGSQSDRQYYATHHQVVHDAGGPRLGEGVPLSIKAVEELCRTLGAKPSSGFLHERVIQWGQESLSWWLPGGSRSAFFHTKDSYLADRSGVVPYPTLIFSFRRGNWQVVAVKGSGRPRASDPVFHAPCLNVWENTRICVGSAVIPKSSDQGEIEAWEAAFFESRFTHSNFHGTPQVDYPGGVYALWADLLDGKHDSFPEECLRPLDKTLEQYLAGN